MVEDREKVIGIVGGMGPEATLSLFSKIIELTPAKKDQDHLKIIIYNNPKIPDRTEAIVDGGESPLPALLDTVKTLKAAGADFLIMPCNTAHYYYNSIKEDLDIPLINMVEETAKKIMDIAPMTKKIGLISTKGTIKSEIYHDALSRYGVEVVLPTDKEQGIIMEVILAIKAGQKSLEHWNTVVGVIGNLVNRGGEGIILGCTELPLLPLKSIKVTVPLYIPQDILAEKAVLLAGVGFSGGKDPGLPEPGCCRK